MVATLPRVDGVTSDAATGPLVRDSWLATLTFTSTLLGAQPTDSIALAWVRQQAIDKLTSELRRTGGMSLVDAKQAAERQVDRDDRIRRDPEAGEDEDDPASSLRVTAFHQDTETGRLYLTDFQLLGHAKEAGRQLGLTVPAKAKGKTLPVRQFIINGLYIFGEDTLGQPEQERRLYLTRNGAYVTEADGVFERPILVNTPSGPRSAIAVSQMLERPIQIRARVVLLHGSPLTEDHIRKIFAWGQYNGLGQWRGGGFGRFATRLERI